MFKLRISTFKFITYRSLRVKTRFKYFQIIILFKPTKLWCGSLVTWNFLCNMRTTIYGIFIYNDLININNFTCIYLMFFPFVSSQ